MQVLRDTTLIFRRQLRLSLRSPAWVVIGLTQPILYLAFFGPLLEQVVGARGFPGHNAWQVFVPGLLVQLALFGSLFVGFGLIAEVRYGVIERMRVTPVSRLALLLGRVLRDVAVLLVQCVVLVLAGLAFGLRASLGGVVVALVIVALLGFAMSSLSYAVALIVRDEDAFAPLLNSVSVPLLLLSGILLPMTLAPTWLYDLSRVNPLSYVVDGARSAFIDRPGTTTVLAGIGVAVGLAVVSALLGTGTFRRRSS